MSIADQITRLQNAKASIKTSIENKGVSVGDDVKLDGYPALIDSIEVGGSGETYINPDFYEVRTQNGTNFDNLFRNYNGPDIDVSKWDTSKVASAQYCFASCTKSFDISNWDLSSLTNVKYMFYYSNTDYLDVRNISLPKVTSYSNMFYSCSGTELDLSSWDISKVTDLYYLTRGSNFKKIDLTGWKTTNVTNMNYMFYSCSNLETLLIPDWDMTNATSTSYFMGSVPKLKYIDLSRSNDLTIKKIASMLPTKKATTYGEILIPANTSQDVIDALTAKYWKPIGLKFDLNSTELVLELDEIKPGKTTKVYTSNNDPWYGDDRLETIEFISSNESIATINGRVITGIAEGTVDIICRRRSDSVVLGSGTLSVTYIDSNPNLIKFRINDSTYDAYFSLITINGTDYAANKYTKDTITGMYSFDPGKQITSIQFGKLGYNCLKDLVKFNFNAANVTNLYEMARGYASEVLDLSDWDTSRVTDFAYFVYKSTKLIEIKGELDLSSSTRTLYAFDECYNLETLYLKNIYKNSTMTNEGEWGISLRDTKVKDECLIYIINELPDLINDKGLTATDRIRLTLPPTNKLTAEQVQPAIDKGWTVVNCNF